MAAAKLKAVASHTRRAGLCICSSSIVGSLHAQPWCI